MELVEQAARLESLNKQREDLVRMVVHDLRSPVTAIQLASSELIAHDHRFNESQRRDLLLIRQEARRVSSYLEEMLLVARQDEGKLSLSRDPVDLGKIARSTIDALVLVADARRVELVEQWDDQPVVVPGDAALLRRVIDNLVTNAIKFSPPGARVEVRLRQEYGQAVIEVDDEGPGVPSEARGRIFEKYEIVKMRAAGGPQTGLGLPFCRMVVEAHGGTVTCLAREPKGSRFYVCLPTSGTTPPSAH